MIYSFLGGVVTALAVTAALFFLKFWKQTRETLFLFFSGAFVLLSISPALIGLQPDESDEGWEFTFRLAAFLLIILGTVWTNTRRR